MCTNMRWLILLCVATTYALKHAILPQTAQEIHTYIKNSSGTLQGVYIRSAFVACYDGDCPAVSGTCFINGPIFPSNIIFDTKGTMPLKPKMGIPFHKSLCCCSYMNVDGAIVWYD